MKTYQVTLTEDQAEAVGCALKNKIKTLKGSREIYLKDLLAHCESAYDALNTAPEVSDLTAILSKIVKKSYKRPGTFEDCHVHPDLIEEARQILARNTKS